MEGLPQIVRQRLQAGGSTSAHPDADVLTAFAERSLSVRERTSVMAHISRCSDCRDVIALALPEAESAAVAAVSSHGWQIGWPVFRWGFALAGVAVLAIGVLQYQQHSRHSMVAQREASEPMAVSVQPAAPKASAQQAEAKQPQHPLSLTKVPSRDEGKAPTASAPSSSSHVSSFSHGALPGGQVVSGPNMPTQWQQQRQQQIPSRLQALGGPIASPGAAGGGVARTSAQTQVAPADTTNSRNVEVSGGLAVNPAPSAPAMFDNSPSIGKAKAAPIQPTPVLTAAMSTPRWSISSSGGLQCSFDQGSTWQDVDVNAPSFRGAAYGYARQEVEVGKARAKEKSSDKKAVQNEISAPVFRTVVSNGADVWAGGTSGALYHSQDAGTRWDQIIVSANGVVLTADIVGLQFSDSLHGTITTSISEVWATSDGGKTWQKQ
ncbi:MAG TPA: hypothetical protein VKV39_20010 [Candidatus Sulfotelmatobacter sp.]|nr:hypothetical protein [Candidatus Sulfotelmatobacter sp.]